MPPGRPRKVKVTETPLQTLASGPFDTIVSPPIVPDPAPPKSDLREPVHPAKADVRPKEDRHRLRGPEEYPVEDLVGSKFHITGPKRRSDGSITSWGDYPEGFDLQWVGVSIWGQHQPQIEAEFTRKGWEPVHHGDFGGKYDGRFLPASYVGPILVEGLLLVARPMSWSNKARGIATKEADSRVAIKVGQLKAGELEGVTLNPQHKHLRDTNYVNVDVETVSKPTLK